MYYKKEAMSDQIRAVMKIICLKNAVYIEKIKLHNHLNAVAVLCGCNPVLKKSRSSGGSDQHTRADTRMSGFAMFFPKDPALLAFAGLRLDDPKNFKTIYGMMTIPYDISIRQILDLVVPNSFRSLFKECFRSLQRGKVFEKMLFMGEGYLFNLDGSGYFLSIIADSFLSEKRVVETRYLLSQGRQDCWCAP